MMKQVTDQKIILVVRETRLEKLVARFNTVQQARFYIEHLGADFSDYVREQARYHEAIGKAEAVLSAHGRLHRLERRYLPNFIFAASDLVVVLGQDGLVANTLKYCDGQTVIGVNPDPDRWDGQLLPFTVGDLARLLPEAMAGRRPLKTVTMLKASLNTGGDLFAVNDLFIGPKTHVSARYALTVGGRTERQSSSGIIVSTGLGSTGWMKSIHAGWTATTAVLTGASPSRDTVVDGSFAWDAQRLRYAVREPFPSRATGASLVMGWIDRETPMTVTSEMPEHGIIFSDGIEADFLAFNSGTLATVGLSDRVGRLVA